MSYHSKSMSLESFDKSKKNTIKMKDIVAKTYLEVTKINPWHLDKKIVNDPDLIKDPLKSEIIKDLLQIRKEGRESFSVFKSVFKTKKAPSSKAKRQELRKKHRNTTIKKSVLSEEAKRIEKSLQNRLNALSRPNTSTTEFSPGFTMLKQEHEIKMEKLRKDNERNKRATILGVPGYHPYQEYEGKLNKPAFPPQKNGESNGMYSFRIEHEETMKRKKKEDSLNARLRML
jgi:hypothetical protein